MSRGGSRPGAGRPQGVVAGAARADFVREAVAAAPGLNLSPLEYMLQVMNDDAADSVRRDRMAQAAAPYVHGRVADTKPGKKDQARKLADEAGKGSDWGTDLESPAVTAPN